MGYALRRAGQAAIVLIAAFTATFLLLQLLPGDAILIKFESPELGLSPEQIADIRALYGADVPVWQQYLHTLGGYVRGDFGYSSQYGTEVLRLIADALPATAALAALGFGVAALLAGAIAFLSTLAPFAWLRGALRALPGLFVSVPVFWLGILLIQVFSFGLGWVPIVGADPVAALVLPVLTLAVPISAPLAQVLVRSIDEVRLQPFATVVRAKGASESWLLWRSVARNAILPTLTIAGVLLGELIGGAVVTETVFGRAGIGRLTEQAVANQDIPVLQGIVVLAALSFVVVNLAVDLLYPVLDPRLRLSARRTRVRLPATTSEVTA
ncbi:Glutathione transport system permease protein GsiC [Microbacterium lemovicicum]|uniref:Glutathione transport system permease protein GsiC n=1 Tax=Microbacterium lemovicicum TaxID=1072463 RepID=A0A3S9WBC5_9MICO|nr:ABC transporter permease [Microbacterium lemovicicum]AZS37379.1 Glutathione transport system permease protein GsiC [Microbacterium lemovicicum]